MDERIWCVWCEAVDSCCLASHKHWSPRENTQPSVIKPFTACSAAFTEQPHENQDIKTIAVLQEATEGELLPLYLLVSGVGGSFTSTLQIPLWCRYEKREAVIVLLPPKHVLKIAAAFNCVFNYYWILHLCSLHMSYFIMSEVAQPASELLSVSSCSFPDLQQHVWL